MAELKIKISADGASANAAIDATKQKIIAAEAAAAAASLAAKQAAAQESQAKIAAINAASAAAEVARAKEAGASAERIKQLTDVAAKAKAVADATQGIGAEKLNQLNAASKAASDKVTALRTEVKSLESATAAADLGKPFAGMSDKMNAAKGSIAALVGSFAAFGLAGKTAMDMETAMTKLNIKANLTAQEVDSLQNEFVKMSTVLPLSAKELAAIGEAGASLGIQKENLRDFTQLTAEMAVGFDMTAEAAGDAAGKLGNVFKLNMDGLRNVANTINALGDSMAATESQIVDVLKRAGGAGQAFGLTANSVAALSATMLSLGESPEVAGTAINNLLTKLQTASVASPAAQDALRLLGFSAKDMGAAIEKDAQGTLTAFLTSLEKLDGKSKTMALSQIFGAGGDTAAISKLAGSLGEYRKALDTAGTSTDGLKNAVDSMAGTSEGRLKIMKSSFESIGISAGKALLPVISAAADLVAGIAQVAAGFVQAHPYIATTIAAVAAGALSFGAISLAVSGVGAVVGAVIAPLSAVAGAVASFGSAAAAVAGPILGIGAAGGTAAVGVGALGTSIAALALPITAAVAGIAALTAAWMYFKDRSETNEAKKSIEDLRKERAKLAADIASGPSASVADMVEIDALQQKQAELDALDKRIASKAAEGAKPEDGKPKGTANALNIPAAATPGQDITKQVLAGTEAAQTAYKARLAANAAALEAESKLRSDAAKRDLEDMKRALDAESITAEEYFAKKLSAAQRDADNQIKVKQQEIAQKAAFKPTSEADKETQRGELAKMRADLEVMRREKVKAEQEIGREVIAARLKAAEEAESRTLGVMMRSLDEQQAMMKRAMSLGLASSAELAQAEAQAAEQRVQIEIAAKERILAARIEANAAPDQIRQAQADVQDAKTKRTASRADALTGITDRIKAQKAQTEDITLSINGDQASRDVIALAAEIEKMRKSAEADAAVLSVQLQTADPEESAKIQQAMIDLEDSTQAAIVAKNAELADKLKPGWQKMLEGWRDTGKLMAASMDQIGQKLVKGGEDAFAEYAKTGKFSTAKMIDDMKDQIARMSYQAMMGKAQGAISGLLGGGDQKQQGQDQGGMLSSAMGAVSGMLGGGASGPAKGGEAAPDQAAGALTALATAATGTAEQTTALTAVQQGLELVQATTSTTQEVAATTATTALMGLSLAADMAAMSMQAQSAQGGAGDLMSLMAATGAVIPQMFAKGGSFVNSIVSSPTLFAFGRGGSKLGLMGEAGPEAIMPMSGGGIRAIDGSGSVVARLGVARDSAGVLSVVMPSGDNAPSAFATGGYFGGLSGVVSRFAVGDVFTGSTPGGGVADVGGSNVVNVNMTNTFASGSDANSIGNALARLKAEVLSAVAEQMKRGNRSFAQ